MEKRSKKIKIIIFGILAVIILVFYSYRAVIFQEGNPLPLLEGIIVLNFGGQEIVKFGDSGAKYLTRSKNGNDLVINKMSEGGYKFIEQLGSGYFFINENLDSLIVTHKYYSRFYSIWTIGESRNIKDSIEWADYSNKEYCFSFRYPLFSINNKWWGNLTEKEPPFNLLLSNQVLNKNNNFYLGPQYDAVVDGRTGELIKTENTFIPEYKEGDHSYPLPWHIVLFNVDDETDLDKVIKNKLGLGCSYKSKIATAFKGNYRVEINGDGKDLSETLCPVNYDNYIIYSPIVKKAAFWSLGQECNIGLGFTSENCFDLKISDSFHFLIN